MGKAGGRVTLARVAAELGVSAMTVSNAYRRPDQLSPALRERVFEAAARLGYAGPDPVARSLRRSRTDVVGVVYSNPLSYAFEDPAAVAFLAGLGGVTEEARLGLLLVPAAAGRPLGERDPRAAGEAAVDGFVVYSMADDEPLLLAALERRLPAVVVDQPLRGGIPFVGIDDRAASREAAEHLIRLGHGRIGVLTSGLSADGGEGFADRSRQEGASFHISRERLAGYGEAISEAGLSWEEVPVYECPGSEEPLGRRAAEALLAREPRPTALLCFSDRLALGAMEAAGELGLSVPGELSIVGFDDAPVIARAAALTTIRQDHAGKGRAAGEMLVSLLRGDEPGTPRLLPTRLVERGSTAPPKAES
jgi:DNA-binding LacI/PurR family transcriptional regulator